MLLSRLFNLSILIVICICSSALAINSLYLVDNYEKSTQILWHSYFEVHSILSMEGQDNPGPNTFERSSKIFRDGPRISVASQDDALMNDGQRFSENRTCILDKKAIIIASEKQGGVFVDSNIIAWRQFAFAGLGGGVITEGSVFGDDDAKLFTILRESNLQMKSEMANIDGHQVYVLEGKSKRGKITVWLDPNANYHPRRIEILKSDDDLLNGRPVKLAKEDNLIKNKQLKEYSMTVDEVKISKIGDVNIMTGANITEVRTYADGYKITARYPFQILNINLKPDFLSTKAFDVNLPDGTPVNNNDFPGDKYEVRQGKIVSAGTSFEQIDKTIDQKKK
jgi:hypothetical protein